MAQKFIKPFGEYPNLLRLFYTPKNSKSYKPNIGLKAINKKRIDNDLIYKKHKQIHNYIVDFGKEEYIIVTPVKGRALSEVESMSQSIVKLG